jgi:hypothetical protein
MRSPVLPGRDSFQSGTPFSIFDSSAATGFPRSGQHAVAGCKPRCRRNRRQRLDRVDIHKRINGYLNPTAFTTAPLLCRFDPPHRKTTCDPVNNPNFCTTGFANVGRSIYHGPFQQNWDASILKYFRISEHQEPGFASDFFNVWNHTNFGNPTVTDIEAYNAWVVNGSLGQDPFGSIVQTVGTPRLIQFPLRWAAL